MLFFLTKVNTLMELGMHDTMMRLYLQTKFLLDRKGSLVMTRQMSVLQLFKMGNRVETENKVSDTKRTKKVEQNGNGLKANLTFWRGQYKTVWFFVDFLFNFPAVFFEIHIYIHSWRIPGLSTVPIWSGQFRFFRHSIPTVYLPEYNCSDFPKYLIKNNDK